MTSRPECERLLARRASSLFVLFVALLLLAPPAARAAPRQQEVGPGAAGKKVYLPVAIGSGTGVGQPTSAELIDAAVASGKLSAETGLTYKVFAAFRDPRLPTEYKGDDSKPHDAPWLRQAAAQWRQLSKATRDTLAPFIQPPVYVQSWYGQRVLGAAAALRPGEVPTPLPGGPWKNVATVGGKARVWWNTDVPGSTQPVAQQVANALSGRVWPMLTGYMKRLPLDDKGPHVFTDLDGNEQVWGDGEDGALDVYIIPGIGHGGAMTVGYPPGCANIPAFMIVDPGMGNFEAAMAHEFMHVVQFAYKSQAECSDLGWLSEGTAHWAIDYVYSSNNYEHGSPLLLAVPYESIDRGYGYDSWPFFWQLDRTLGLHDAVRLIWEKTEQVKTTKAAIDAALPGGWAAQWPKTALHNLNRAPVDELKRLDQWDEQAALRHDEALKLDGAAQKSFALNAVQYAPSAKYYHFTFPDPSIRSVAFVNPYTADKYPTVHVQALARMEGKTTWEPVIDWSGTPGGAFCREVKAERVEELYVVISDYEWQGPGHLDKYDPAPSIEVSNLACRGWEGEVTYKSWHIDEIEPGVVLSEINQDFWTGATFLHAPKPDWLQGPVHYFTIDPSVEVSVNDWGWSLSADEPPIKCNYLVDDVGPVQTEQTQLLIYADKSRAYGAWGAMPVFDLQGTDSCEGTITVHYDRPDWWLTGDDNNAPTWTISPDGKSFSGKWERYRTPTSWATYEWTFTALPPE